MTKRPKARGSDCLRWRLCMYTDYASTTPAIHPSYRSPSCGHLGQLVSLCTTTTNWGTPASLRGYSHLFLTLLHLQVCLNFAPSKVDYCEISKIGSSRERGTASVGGAAEVADVIHRATWRIIVAGKQRNPITGRRRPTWLCRLWLRSAKRATPSSYLPTAYLAGLVLLLPPV